MKIKLFLLWAFFALFIVAARNVEIFGEVLMILICAGVLTFGFLKLLNLIKSQVFGIKQEPEKVNAHAMDEYSEYEEL